jgi:hypothetical protein
MKTFPRGSEWRKWDLHIHTPASVLRNEFGHDWDSYVVTLFKKAIEHNISAIGVTDYYLPEGYKILKTEYLNNHLKLTSLFSSEEIEKINRIKVFPNIEFRLTKLVVGKEKDLSWNRKVNYHVILSDELSIDKIESDFISQIKVNFDASTGVSQEKRPLTKSTLEELGNRLIKDHPPFADSGSPLFVGMLNASVDEDDLVSILNSNSHFRDKYLLGLPADEDLSEVSWNSQGHNIRKNLLKQAHFIFSSNHKTRTFLLGGNNKNAFVSEFGAIKPCLWGSDAHKTEELFVPDKNRNTWIKADLSFEGLKQVVYDPESRVNIQELNPQQKSSYQTIDSVRFIDKTSSNLFSGEWQPLNPDLNTIIGGKSSGKSLLLYHIAKAINAQEVYNKVILSKSSSYSDLKNVDFEVRWSNGDISQLSNESDSKPITYIPQLYINHLAEEDGREQLNDLVKNILSQNNSFKQFSLDQEKLIATINKEIVDKIDRLFELKEKHSTLSKELFSYGTKSAIESEIKKLTDTISNLREKSGFNEEQENNYKRLVLRKGALESRKSALEKISLCAKQIETSSQERSSSFISSFRESIISDIDIPKNSTFLTNLMDELESRLQEAIGNFGRYTREKEKRIPQLLPKIEEQIRTIEVELIPLLQKVTDQKTLELISKQLKAEEDKLKKINETEKVQSAIQDQCYEIEIDLMKSYENLISSYKNYVLEIAKPAYQLEEGIRIDATVSFSEDKFSEFVRIFDGRGNLSLFLGDLVDANGNYVFDIDRHAESISAIHKNISSKSNIPLIRKGIADKEIIRRLYSDCFYINFVVCYREDDIVRMSPGKRGLVLLNLILHLSNASHPILIDQPEDNLDNRTIYDQLNGFIRQRKSKRQIIMVTHNANLVVAADSECIIVANQAGQQADIENEKYKFEYCSGSLEFSFEDDGKSGALYKKGIRQHVCEILEGGVLAFKEREMKYGFKL